MENFNEKNVLIKKVSHVLKSTPENYAFLTKLKVQDISRLNDDIQEAIYGEQSIHWERVSKVVKFFPNFMNAKISEQVLGAHITANICYHVDSKDLIGISKHLSVPFLAEVTEHMIPAKSSRVVNIVPESILQKVIEYLMNKEQHFVVASFIESVERMKLLDLIHHIPDEKDLVKCSEYIRNPLLLKDIFMNFSSIRQMKIIQAAIQLNKEDIIIQVLWEIEDDERSKILTDFAKKFPTTATEFIDKVNEKN